MNKKNIKRNIERKINKWCDSIKDKDLVKDIKKDIIVTGGCFVSLLNNEDVNDYDVYFSTKETAYNVAKYYVEKSGRNDIFVASSQEEFISHFNKLVQREKTLYASEEEAFEVLKDAVGNYKDDRVFIYIPSSGIASTEEFEKQKEKQFATQHSKEEKSEKKETYETVFISSNAITLTNDIQIIIRFFGTPEEIHENFDYVHTKNYYYDGKVVLNPDSIESIITKELRYDGTSKYPLCSLFRLRKFIKRGWHITGGDILKMAFQIKELDLYNIECLKDQLIGVDSTHFLYLINKLSQKDNKVDLSFVYICNLIDEIFH